MADELERVGGYDLVEWLGDGDNGPIYRAVQRSLDRVVIVKVLAPERAADPAVRRAFVARARPLARVAHTNLVCGLDVGEDEERAWFVLEAAVGKTIEDHMKEHGRLPERQSLRVVYKIARALDAMHRKLLVHSNIRPRSIVITREGVPKLTDYDLVSLESARDLADQGSPSTAWYLAPERVRGETTGDVASDIYALGATLFHMLAGRPPFEGQTREEVEAKHVSAPPPLIRALVPSIHPGTEEAIKRCLAKRAGDRPVNGGELADALEAVSKSATGAQVPPPAKGQALPPPESGRAQAGQVPVSRRRRRRRR